MLTGRDYLQTLDIDDRSLWQKKYAGFGFLIGPPNYDSGSVFSQAFGHSIDSMVGELPPAVEVHIGRSTDAAIKLPKVKIYSRKHAVALQTENGLQLTNLSVNSTYVKAVSLLATAREQASIRGRPDDGYLVLHQGDDIIVPCNGLTRFGPTLDSVLTHFDNDMSQSSTHEFELPSREELDRPDRVEFNMPWLYLDAEGFQRFLKTRRSKDVVDLT